MQTSENFSGARKIESALKQRPKTLCRIKLELHDIS
jgi:hypothetical protein